MAGVLVIWTAAMHVLGQFALFACNVDNVIHRSVPISGILSKPFQFNLSVTCVSPTAFQQFLRKPSTGAVRGISCCRQVAGGRTSTFDA